MQPFRFRLERVFDWQQTVCRLEEEKMRLCRFAIAETEEKLAQLKAGSLATEHELFKRPTLTAADLKALAEFRLKVIKQGRALAAEKQARIQALEKQTEKLQAERHRLRLIEKTPRAGSRRLHPGRQSGTRNPGPGVPSLEMGFEFPASTRLRFD